MSIPRTTPRRRRVTTAGRSRWVRVRIQVASVALVLLLAAIGVKAYRIQIDDAERYRAMAERQHLRTLSIPAPRGVLYDTRGRELAATAKADSVFASPRRIDDVTGTAEALADALELDLRSLEAKLASPRRFVWIARHVTPERAQAVAELELPGIELTAEPKRYYPGRELAGPVIGFANIDGKGIEGVERAMNELLEGVQGELPALRDARGRMMLSGTDAGDVPGASVYLSLDRSIQDITESKLFAALETHEAKAGVALVLEVSTGRVLAMANAPNYDPNKPGPLTRTGARNRAITDVYEMGSVMKLFTIAAALEAKVIRHDQIFDVERGKFKVGRKWIRDSHRDWELDVTGIIRRSSNVGAVKIARKLGAEGLRAALLRYGFSTATGIELPGERAGVLRPTKRWGQIGLATAAFGYGMSSTPLQVAAAVAAIANGGIYHQPRIVREVRDDSGETVYEHQPKGHRVLSRVVADRVRDMMSSVFDRGRRGGTARGVTVRGYTAGGKTSTAHKVDPSTGRYSKHMYLSSFVGLAPLDDPRIVVLVVIDEPGGKEHYGGKVAGPAAGEILSEALHYLGVPENAPVEATEQDKADKPIEPKKPSTDSAAAAEAEIAAAPNTATDQLSEALTDALGGTRVPDFSGMSIAQVLVRAREAGIQVEIVGSGRALSQTPEAGVPAQAGDKGANCRVVFDPGYR